MGDRERERDKDTDEFRLLLFLRLLLLSFVLPRNIVYRYLNITSPKGEDSFAHHASGEYFRGHHNQTPVHGAIETHDRGTKGVCRLSGARN